MRIFIPILGFARAGGYRVLSKLASEWAKQGHEVFFIINYRSEAPYFPTVASIIWINDRGAQVEINSPELKKPNFWVFRNLLSLKRAIDSLVKDRESIILANHSLTAYPVFFSSSPGKKFYYIQAYEPEFYSCKIKESVSNFILFFLSSLTYFFPLKRIVNSPVYFRYKLCRANWYVPPGLDQAVFLPKKELSKTVNKVGIIGREDEFKGTAIGCQVFTVLQEEFEHLELRVAYYLPKKYKDKKNVFHIVPQNDQELSDFYRSCDVILALGTIQLGAPHYPVIEGMACGCAMVTTGYFPATEDNAWIVPVGDIHMPVSIVRQLIKNPELAIEKLEKALADCQELAWINVAQKMMGYFNCNE